MIEKRDEDPLTEEIEAALMAGAPGEDEKNAWVREALERAEGMPAPTKPVRGRRLLPALAAAAAILVLTGLVIGSWGTAPREERAPALAGPEPTRREAYEAARRINEAALLKPEIKDRLAAAKKGSWAAVADGRLIAIAGTPRDLQEKMKDLEVRSAQAFIWEIGTEGDITCETTFPYEMVVGNAFLARCDLAFAMGPDGAAFWTGDRPPSIEGQKRFPSHDGRMYLPLDILHPLGPDHLAASSNFLVATGYGGPLILPEPPPTLLCFDTPGLATVKGMGQSRVYRRFTTRVRNRTLGIDELVPALGGLRSPPPPVEIGGVTWPRHGPEIIETARDSGKPLAVLVWDAGKVASLAPFATPGLSAKLDRFTRAYHATSWTDPHALSGAPFASPAELVVYRRAGGKGRGMILVGRQPLAEGSAVLVEALIDRGLGKFEDGRYAFRPSRALDNALKQRLTASLEARFRHTKIVVSVGDQVELTVPWNSPLKRAAILRRCTLTGEVAFRILAEDGDPTSNGPLDLAREAAARREDTTEYEPPKSADTDYPGYRWYRFRDDAEDGTARWALVRVDRWNFGSGDLEKVGTSPTPRPPGLDWIVEFGIREARRNDFGAFTGSNSDDHLGAGFGRKLAIILDGRIIRAPVLRSKLTNGGFIEGGFSRSEAEDFAVVLRSGDLPVRLIPVER